MNAKVKKLLFRVGTLLIVLAVAAVMMVIGRGHTVYFDNKTLEYNGTEYKAYYKIEVSTKEMEKTAKLMARDRGMSKWVGQNFRMDLVVTPHEGDEPQYLSIERLNLPYGIDNPIINLPALLNGLPQEAWLDEFIPTPSTEDLTDDVDLGDPFGGMGAEVTEDGELPDAGADIMG